MITIFSPLSNRCLRSFALISCFEFESSGVIPEVFAIAILVIKSAAARAAIEGARILFNLISGLLLDKTLSGAVPSAGSAPLNRQ
jgi:hypothetical protein